MHVFSFLCYNSQWGGWPAIDGCCIHWRAQSKIWLMKPKSNGEIIHSDKSILVFIFHFDGISLTTDFFIFKWQSSKTYFFSDCTGKVSNHERALHATGRDKYIQQLWQMHCSIWTNTESMDWKSVNCISMDFVAVYIRMDWESADSRECIAPTMISNPPTLSHSSSLASTWLLFTIIMAAINRYLLFPRAQILLSIFEYFAWYIFFQGPRAGEGKLERTCPGFTFLFRHLITGKRKEKMGQKTFSRKKRAEKELY